MELGEKSSTGVTELHRAENNRGTRCYTRHSGGTCVRGDSHGGVVREGTRHRDVGSRNGAVYEKERQPLRPKHISGISDETDKQRLTLTERSAESFCPLAFSAQTVKSRMEPPPPQICTVRLKSFRQRINRTVMTITDSGYVSMEIMCRHSNQSNSEEITKELFHISPDGRNVEVYQNVDGVAVLEGCPLPDQPYKLFTYPDLPGKQMKKYQHAYKFVELVKSRTAKVMLVTDTAQCKLMENSVPADFKADFHNGSSVVISKSTVTVTDKAGGSLTFDVQSVSQYISPDTLQLVQHAYMCHHKCLEIERTVSSIHTPGGNNEMFPVTIGSKSPYRIASVSQESTSLNNAGRNDHVELPLLPQYHQQSESQVQTWLGQGEELSCKDDLQARSMGESICSEKELCDLLERQLDEFNGSSRGSSLINMSRSVTPQKRSSITQWDNTKNTKTQALFQQVSTNPLPAAGASLDQSNKSYIQQPNIHSTFPTMSNEQFFLHTSNAPYSEQLFAVPSSSPQNLENIAANFFTSPTQGIFSMGNDCSYSQVKTEPVASLVCSIRSNHVDEKHQLALSTPSRDTLLQQQQDRHDPQDIISLKRSHQYHHQDEHTRLLLEHRHSWVQGQLEHEALGAGVRRALFNNLDMDLSLPISSPASTSGTQALQHDLLAIKPTPSLDLSDCGDRPDGGRQPQIDNTQDLLLHQSVSDNCVEEFNTSFDFISNNQDSKDAILAPVIGEEVLKQADISHISSTQAVVMSPQIIRPHELVLVQASAADDFHVSQPSPLLRCSPPQATPQNDSQQSSNPQLTLNASLDHSLPETSQKGFTIPGMTLGLVKPHKNHMDKRRGSNSVIPSGCGCSNSSSSSSSNNTSCCLDLPSPQPTLPCLALPPQLRHSLDISASSHYSDSSAPSSSGAGDVVRQLFVPYTGWASLHATGAVWILYNDGTQVGIKSTEPAMIYVDQDGKENRYSTTDTVPEIVRLKLEKLPSIVDQLMKAPVAITPGQLSHTGSTHKA
ncbi:hypothetical protein RRG08_017084 [Elysia crispata]|uniref:Uncharacterized protein n=1 Tax=Elysia crispata TaxID=231223 RepID=A0AAE0ZV69_9GAST|nr:hypothetical protein RRG08_017084 [Elysia crispata]